MIEERNAVAATTNNHELLQVDSLKKHFFLTEGPFSTKKRVIKAVDGVSFTIASGETLGLVGESGCGKSTLGKVVMGLIEPTEGDVYFDGDRIFRMPRRKRRQLRRRMQIIFQDPYSSLNPRMTAGYIIGEGLRIHGLASGDALKQRVEEMLSVVGLRPRDAERYPHEFSGGQRQRIGIARALALNPSLIVADEPVSSLDVSIQAQILNLIKDLRDQFGLTFLFISHDLSVIWHMCDRVAVMMNGKFVEMAPRQEIFKNPVHPYTRLLRDTVPVPDPDVLRGNVSPRVEPNCNVHEHCLQVPVPCPREDFELVEFSDHHYVACHAELFRD
ncbi:MAG: ABC transporter ATP-binding protein [Deltaproteobacteria bacterium]|nr:ABC transporter ATP-binding protein [Deltaproteobacteria bacterium]MBW2306556.1 ABC transporter ATP-binding protein [Deltaproteobacteria bacterium]